MSAQTPPSVTLLPCPFCGCAVKLAAEQRRDELYGLRTWYHIKGDHDGIGGVCPGEVRGRGSEETAITAWNTRTTAEAASAARVAELRNAALDALAGWRYIRQHHGDLYGVGWDRVENALTAALAKHRQGEVA